MREALAILVLYFAAVLCISQAEAQPQGRFAPRPEGQYYQAPPVVVQQPPVVVQPPPQVYLPPPTFVPTPGVWVPVRRPTWVGQWLFGDVYYFVPTPPQQSAPPPFPPPEQQQSSRQMPVRLRAVPTPNDHVPQGPPQTLSGPIEVQ